MRDAVILDAIRTPVGRYAGALRDVRPDDLAAHVIQAIVRRNTLDPAAIEDVVLGCANQAGEDNRNVARMAALLAGLPVEVPGQTVNRLCGSGMQAVHAAAHAIACGLGDVYIAGGVESMTRAPYVLASPQEAFPRGPMVLQDTTIGWRFPNPKLAEVYPLYSMGETAENVAERYGISRDDQDVFAWESQQRASAAQREGRFAEEIVPVTVPRPRGAPVVVDADEHPRPDTTLEGLAGLRPAFRAGGTVTAGNSSGINDGAAALLVTSAEWAEREGRRPIARIAAAAVAGVDPSYMGIGPVPASRKALVRAGRRIDEMDLIELNEAFAVQVLACVRDLDIDRARLNPNGGAIALGHPIGASGARILATLAHEMRRRQARWGLATMCIGVGQGIATVVEGLA
ncbi:MAG: acetyl-CoA C-acyltransferase [Bacillati bacterium ANGP1]|uniref:acetyl-CoA C-acyltransferase n=1 Tax=Candidatus Segetimicrobium genomatis TaxID=2569760 RepID=A0A537JB77_9BACT|nr:MAG: acetyl-CoA C-acyltransferase [Terrabacteria group bacterium ANGP1]